MSGSKLKLLCQCGTIYVAAELPLDIKSLVALINTTECPACNKGSKTACISTGEENEPRAQR